MNTEFKTRRLICISLTAAVYAVMTIMLAPLSYGPIQLRLSELLCVLPFFIPYTAWGLFAGCVIANLAAGNVFDIIFGSLATLAAAFITARCGRAGNRFIHRFLACLAPVVINALVIGAVICAGYEGINIAEHPGMYLLNATYIAGGEALVTLVIGLPLTRKLPGWRFFREFLSCFGEPEKR